MKNKKYADKWAVKVNVCDNAGDIIMGYGADALRTPRKTDIEIRANYTYDYSVKKHAPSKKHPIENWLDSLCKELPKTMDSCHGAVVAEFNTCHRLPDEIKDCIFAILIGYIGIDGSESPMLYCDNPPLKTNILLNLLEDRPCVDIYCELLYHDLILARDLRDSIFRHLKQHSVSRIKSF
jgi:hypothetical protein